MTKIEHTNEMPSGWMKSYCIHTETEAEQIAAGRESYLYRSNVIDAFFLFIPVVDDETMRVRA